MSNEAEHLDYGTLVMVTDGKLKGYVGEYDDDDMETGTAIVYLHNRPSYDLIPFESLRALTDEEAKPIIEQSEVLKKEMIKNGNEKQPE